MVQCNRPLDSHAVHWQEGFAGSARFSGSRRIRHRSLPLGNSHLDSINSCKAVFISLYQNLIHHQELQQPLSAKKALYHLLHLVKKNNLNSLLWLVSHISKVKLGLGARTILCSLLSICTDNTLSWWLPS